MVVPFRLDVAGLTVAGRRAFLALVMLAAAPVAACTAGNATAAAANRAMLDTLAHALFGRPATGWRIYAPKAAWTVGSRCAAVTPGFATALARWQARQGLPATGVMDVPSLMRLAQSWNRARPWVRATAGGACPLPPPETALATAAPGESYAGKTIVLRADTLAAWRRLVADARRALPGLGPEWLTIFSGYRPPDDEAARCADGSCTGVAKASCSSHRTGTSVDAFVGHAPGLPPDSSDDVNRAAMTDSRAYRWLVANAGRHGFVNYVFEPWHWEWTGKEAPR